jgi:hypothetical protein
VKFIIPQISGAITRIYLKCLKQLANLADVRSKPLGIIGMVDDSSPQFAGGDGLALC